MMRVGPASMMGVASLTGIACQREAGRVDGAAQPHGAEPLRTGSRLFIAGRAGTCVRVAATARRAGLIPVGVFVPAERDARWVGVFDDVREVPSYTDHRALVEAALSMGATLIHPGVGFLAESPDFAQLAVESGLVWLGPGEQVLRQLSDKLALPAVAHSCGVPTLPVLGPLRDRDELRQAVQSQPFATYGGMLKTIRGGGGRGVVPVTGLDEADAAWAMAGDLGPLLLQAYLPHARHIEVQACADAYGRVVSMGTRECSVQRRAQKLIEEAPAPALDPGLARQLEAWTREIFKAAGYVGVGTCEFLLPTSGSALCAAGQAQAGSQAGAVLLEVNARLQVEHAVTEEITGLDLVALQIALGAGASMDEAVAYAGLPGATVGVDIPRVESLHAIQARIYAEDPLTLLPATGELSRMSFPLSLESERRCAASGHSPALPRLRMERAVFGGDALQPDFSEPLALVTVTAHTRAQALTALDEALAACSCEGVETLTPLLREVLAHPDFRDAPGQALSTHWLESTLRPNSLREYSAHVRQLTDTGHSPSPASAAPIELRTPLGATLIQPARTGTVTQGEQVAVVEAMKMRVPLIAPCAGQITLPDPPPRQGDSLPAGAALAVLTPLASASDSSLPDLPAGVPESGGTDASASSSRRDVSSRRARERVARLVDPGSLRRLTQADAVVTARARLAGREIALWVQDPGHLGGTIGLAGARCVAELIDEAADEGIPIVSILDGGGARIQEGVDALGGVGLILGAMTRARGRSMQVAMVLGAAAGGAAYAPALADFLIMVDGAAQLFLTGPAILAASTGERISAQDLGGAGVHAQHSGSAHLVYVDESDAFDSARRLMMWAGVWREGTRYLPLRTGGLGSDRVPSDMSVVATVPADSQQPYDVREMLRHLIDRSQLWELRPHWGGSVVTGLAHLDGLPIGIVATQPAVMAGVITPQASDKIAEHVALCQRLGLPVLTVVDTPGFLPGSQAESSGAIRLGARVVSTYASLGADAVPPVTLITRQAFGGAFVALGSHALSGARTAAWSHARVGVMDAGSAVDLVHRRTLKADRAISQDLARRHRQALIEAERDAQRAERGLAEGWIDTVLAPEESRSWLAGVLSDGVHVTSLGGVRHCGDGWVECQCGKRHWGLNGAAGILLWRWVHSNHPQACEDRGDQTGEGVAAASEIITPCSTAGGEQLEILMQLRASWTHHGGTWGLPGGAVADGESPAEGALRECEEETGIPSRVIDLGECHVQEHGSWRYSTFIGTLRELSGGNAAQDSPVRSVDRLICPDGESAALRWIRVRVEHGRWQAPPVPMLPAMQAIWEELAALLPQPGGASDMALGSSGSQVSGD